MHAVKLTRSFDPPSLQAAYRAVQKAVEVMTPAGYPGEGHRGWSSICLHSPATGASPVLEHAPYFRGVLAELQLQLRLARLLVLAPGGVIREHQDSFLSRRIVRLHVPLVTHPDVEMYLGGHRCQWQPGELWYGDFSLPHSGVNRSPLTRVHLVLDVTADQDLLRLFPADQVPARLAQRASEAETQELDQAVIDRFAVDFTLPAGFQLPGLDPLASPTAGCIRLVDSELCVFVNQQPMLKAVPVAEDTLDLIGLGVEARLQYRFEGPSVAQVVLTLGAVPVIALDVLPRS